MIARVLAEKDTLRSQLMELQQQLLSLQTRGGPEQQRVMQTTPAAAAAAAAACRAASLQALICVSSQEADVDWEGVRSSPEAQLHSRRRLCRMDAINPLSASFCTAEVPVCLPACLSLNSNLSWSVSL